jgi:kynureninase
MSELTETQNIDQTDQLSSFRKLFLYPQGKIYFCGNSLGLQPKSSRDFIEKELKKWAEMAVEGHFASPEPWVEIHKRAKPVLQKLLGANELEVSPMNSLTNDLHFMLWSFYRPKGKRNKILIEKGAFPSDAYAVDAHAHYHGLDPNEVIIEMSPEDGKDLLDDQRIVEKINELGDELAMVMFPGVQYYTGQFFDLREISAAAHRVGAYACFDLAHAIGNVPLNLHDWGVDAAVWCTYKYLNSGPGAVAGMFVHDKYAHDESITRPAGWWGHNEARRFKMERKFDMMPGVDGWHQSNMNILSMAAHLASLEIFNSVDLEKLFQKSRQLTGYLEELINGLQGVRIITPSDPEKRGCQLSLSFENHGREAFEKLMGHGVVCDWREPNVIRLAPAPLYNTFEEVKRCYEIIANVLNERK